MPTKRLREFLDANKIKYTVLSHSTAYTAQEVASLAHIRGQALAKTVMVKLDGRMAMAVLPASRHVDLALLRSTAGARKAEVATEREFRDLFPECETGAMPPFGNLYGLAVFVEQSLTDDTEIAFSSGTHNELVQLAYGDFARLVQPTILAFAEKAA